VLVPPRIAGGCVVTSGTSSGMTTAVVPAAVVPLPALAPPLFAFWFVEFPLLPPPALLGALVDVGLVPDGVAVPVAAEGAAAGAWLGAFCTKLRNCDPVLAGAGAGGVVGSTGRAATGSAVIVVLYLGPLSASRVPREIAS
jgi:hypothetical protein